MQAADNNKTFFDTLTRLRGLSEAFEVEASQHAVTQSTKLQELVDHLRDVVSSLKQCAALMPQNFSIIMPMQRKPDGSRINPTTAVDVLCSSCFQLWVGAIMQNCITVKISVVQGILML